MAISNDSIQQPREAGAITLPYDHQAVADILRAEIEPDEKRRRLHEALCRFDYAIERENISGLVPMLRANGEELIFGRMSRAFHNQGLLLANAGYVQPDISTKMLVEQLATESSFSPRLATHIGRLRILRSGMTAVPLTATMGALESLENAILDAQRDQLAALLQAEREGRSTDNESPQEIMAGAQRLLASCRELRDALLTAPRRQAAQVILCQRLSPTGSHLIARINAHESPYLGKPENLRVLERQVGERIYASPDHRWLQHADHWIEAIPLFIKERVLIVDGVETTETVIDQQAMEESFREQMAEHWAINIAHVMDSEHVALARELYARTDARLAGDDAARAHAVTQYGLAEIIGNIATLIAAIYQKHTPEIHQLAEGAQLSRYDALCRWLDESVLSGNPDNLVSALTAALPHPDGMPVNSDTLVQLAGLPRRAVPALHVLTTQSARMTDGYIASWLDESMALFNVVRAHGLDEEVNAQLRAYATLITRLGAQLIRELGLWEEVEALMARDQLNEARAISRFIAGNPTLARQVSVLAVLAEFTSLQPGEEAPLVEDILAARADTLYDPALEGVFQRNEQELFSTMDAYLRAHAGSGRREALRALILDNPDYADDMSAFLRFEAREEAIRALDRQHPQRQLAARVRDWLRNHTRLPLTTARRAVVLAHGLQHLTMHPRFYYRAVGGNKRYHLLYTPSRVDLGTRERESVESWAQWVGGADREAARAGYRLYSLINKHVQVFDSLTEPEVLKTGENASMVAHYAYSNVMSLLVNAVGSGDIEELGDQMSLRKDRLIHPGGEGYGGYCVPKDGLFLEFVLVLTRPTKLRQLGIPDHAHARVVTLAQQVLSRRLEFAGELAWEAWAMEQVAGLHEICDVFTLRAGEDEPIPVFQITRIAQALTRLGRPELTGTAEVMTNLAARWGIHKMIVGGEQVNRFMPFFKVWLTYQALEEAARRNADVHLSPHEAVVVLTGEYKPDTQDGRFSVGMRKFEIFAGTAEHLTFALDLPGQDIVQLMFRGFPALLKQAHDPQVRARLTRLLHELRVAEDDAEKIERLSALFPGYRPPAEIRVVSPMGLATSDLLHYTSDTTLENLAQEARRWLLDAGLTEQEIVANMQVYGPRLARWSRLRALPDERQALAARLGGRLHALALQILGPVRQYEEALRGADVLDTGIPHRALLDLLASPVRIRELMLDGNPSSALAIVDGASGARHRAMNRLAVMRWFAAGEAIDRQTVYRCIGIGEETVAGWRETMRHQRARARQLYEALAAGNIAAARASYQEILTDVLGAHEALQNLQSAERLARFGRETAQEIAVSRALTAVAGGLPFEQLDFASWLALGGQFWLMGMTPARMDEKRRVFETAIASLTGEVPAADASVVDTLYCPAVVADAVEFHEEKGVESSNKATEEVAAVALDTRQRLAARVAHARALRDRAGAFQEELTSAAAFTFDELAAAAHRLRGEGDGVDQGAFGRLQAITGLAFLALARELFGEDAEPTTQLATHVEALFTGRELDPQAIRAISGGYEDIGDIARLADRVAAMFRTDQIDQAERDRLLTRVASLAELFDCCRAIDATIDLADHSTDALPVWRALASFFAETLNDHTHEYRPWAYSRGIAFVHLTGEPLYELAVRHHRWLYRYLRGIMLRMTELRELPAGELEPLLGDMASAADTPPIGAGGDTAAERAWRAYNQLRELAFIRNDGLPLPRVFPEFDPVIIAADTRINLAFLYPVGRTHVSRALMEGPTLAGELIANGQRGANLLITRDARIAEIPGTGQQGLWASDGHLYLSKAEYIAALQRHRQLTPEEASALADRHAGSKGVRIAARFTSPILLGLAIPFHGHPKYTSGQLEELGLPYSVQSLFHTWSTYDKAKYRDIFDAASGVELPAEIDWLAAGTAELGEDARMAIIAGDAARGFPGLRAFARQHRLVMVKDAAESGGRGQKAFTLAKPDGTPDEVEIGRAAEFIYRLSLRHNVAIQEVVISSPEYWATEEFLQSFVDRQIQEWGAAVNRAHHPYTPIYGSHRLVFSTDDPRGGEWHSSHPITLNSRQLITNVGRGGTLELFRPEIIRPEFRTLLPQRLREAGERSMAALMRYGERAAAQYRRETGREIGEDATGLSYATPRYMMLDFLVQPIFAEEGTQVDIAPDYDAGGQRIGSRLMLQHGQERFAGTVTDWRVVLIEPNIGIGLWDRVALREEKLGDPAQIGANARIVLRDLAAAGAAYLTALGAWKDEG